MDICADRSDIESCSAKTIQQVAHALELSFRRKTMIDISKMQCMSYDYEMWERWFRENDKQRLKIDFSTEKLLASEARKLIFPSIKAFQIGEHSDGKILLKAVSRFAEKINSPAYKAVMIGFIKEENCHSAYLAQYLNYHKEPLKKRSFLDSIFRSIRRIGGIFFEISVLETGEIVALSYYTALRNTANKLNSTALASICDQMLRDELRHIVLQSYTISKMKTNPFKRLFRKLLMLLTTDVVWLAYHRLLVTGDYSYSRFRKENLGYLDQSISISDSMRKNRE